METGRRRFFKMLVAAALAPFAVVQALATKKPKYVFGVDLACLPESDEWVKLEVFYSPASPHPAVYVNGEAYGEIARVVKC